MPPFLYSTLSETRGGAPELQADYITHMYNPKLQTLSPLCVFNTERDEEAQELQADVRTLTYALQMYADVC
jgi:hypothetical protein